MRHVVIATAAFAAALCPTLASAQSAPERPTPTLQEIEQARSTYIFQFDATVNRGQMRARAGEVVNKAGGRLRHVYTNILGGFAASLPAAALRHVLDEPGIVAVQRDRIATVTHHRDGHDGGPKSNDDDDGGDEPTLACRDKDSYEDFRPWGIKRTGADEVHGDNCGAGIHVYVLDTGIDLGHASLKPVDKSVDCTRGPNCERGGDGADDHGHGTHVAGTIAARINNSDVVGVAPAASLHSVKVLKSNGIGFRSDIIAGIDWIAGKAKDRNEPVVANASFGGSGSKSGSCSQNGFDGNDAYYRAYCEAANAGVIFVTSAGNSGADAEGHVPAAYYDAVITVSATECHDCNEGGYNDWPEWSNWGNNDPDDWPGNESAPVTLAGPGVDVRSTRMGGGTMEMSGTSMAAPHVAGTAALFLANNGYSADYSAFMGIRGALLEVAEPTGSFRNDSGKPHEEPFVCAVVSAENEACGN